MSSNSRRQTSAICPRFRRVKAPTPAALDLLVHTLSDRIARHLERRGLRVRDPENDYLTLGASDDSTLDDLRGHSIPYRIALGPHAGRKAFTLQTLPSTGEFEHGLARANGFSLHAECGRRCRRARETGTDVPHHRAACGEHRTTLVDGTRSDPLPPEDADSGWQRTGCSSLTLIYGSR